MASKKTKKSVKKIAKKVTKKAVKKSTSHNKSAKKKSSAKASTRKVKKATKKTVAKVPQRSTTINPYLTFNGNCEDAFNFYKSVFGGEFPYIGRFKDMPPMDGQSVPESQAEKIMHVSLPISSETVLMGSDSSEAFGQVTNVGNNFSVSIDAKSQKDADRLFNGLSSGGQVTMPMGKTFWGSYFGMFTDRYDIQWMVSFDENQ